MLVSLSSDTFKLQFAFVTAAGSTGANQGEITLRVAGDGDNRSGIRIGDNISRDGFYTVPAGKKAYYIWGIASVNKNKDARIEVKVDTGGDLLFLSRLPFRLYQNVEIIQPKSPFRELSEGTNIQPIVDSENNNTEVNLVYQIWEVDE